MAFFEHLGELRRRLTVVAAVLFGLTIIFYVFGSSQFVTFILNPILPFVPGHKWYILDPLEGMTLRFTSAFVLAIIVGSPVITYHSFGFFLPALKPNERKYVVPTSIAAAVLFIMGMAFCFTLLYRPGFQWLMTQGVPNAMLTPRALEFFNLAVLLHLAFGVGFLLPIVVFYLLFFQIVPYKTLRQQWRYVYLGISVISAVVTPDWSPWTMGGLAVALMILYEITMLLGRFVLAKKIAAQNAGATDFAD